MVQEASAMYLEAVELMEDDGKESMALDIFRQAIGSLFSHMDHLFLLLFPHLFPYFSFSHAANHPSIRLPFIHPCSRSNIQ